MRYYLVRELVLVAALAAAGGCESNRGSSRLGEDSAVGGAAGSAGNPTGGRGGGGGQPTGGKQGTGGGGALTPLQVCRDAVNVQYERTAVCIGQPRVNPLYSVAEACPDYYFGPDSNRTIEGIAACIPKLAARTCTDVALGVNPVDCLTTGKRPFAARCGFSSQCQSGSCDASDISCGKCYGSQAEVGQACTKSTDCKGHSFCSQKTNTCVDADTIRYVNQGEACDLSAEPPTGCVGDLFCKSSTVYSAGTCTAPGGPGEPCASNYSSSTLCASGSTCIGGTCVAAGTCGTGAPCDGSSYCTMQGDALVCAKRATLGQQCSMSSFQSSPPCLGPTACSPTTGKCYSQRELGDPCDADNPCGSRLACKAGTCQPLSVNCPL